MCLATELPERHVALPEQAPAHPRRRTVQPLTWIVSVALMPVLLYDVWQTAHDVNHRHAAAAANTTVSLSSTAAAAAELTRRLTLGLPLLMRSLISLT